MCSHHCSSGLLGLISDSVRCSTPLLGNKSVANVGDGCSGRLSSSLFSRAVKSERWSQFDIPACIGTDDVEHSFSSLLLLESRRRRRSTILNLLDKHLVQCTNLPFGQDFVHSASSISCIRARNAALNETETVGMGLQTYQLSDLTPSDLQGLLARPRINFDAIFSSVLPIVEDVRVRGDNAVQDFTEKFDGVRLEQIVERIDDMEDPQLDTDVAAAFDVAFENIKRFHVAQKKMQPLEVETMPGVVCKRVARPIESVGLYIPGGTAVLPSTALMLAVPAGIAGCRTIVVATPPRKDGSIAPEVLYCAKKAGATHILKAGGAQAVAAMAWGTTTCPKVDKILGPGNQYVTAAKMVLQNSEAMVSIDMPAGPSEVLVIADKGASHVHVAADLLSQAEHGPDSQVVLVAVGKDVDLAGIEEEVGRQCKALPRSDIALKALSHSYCAVADSMEEACKFSNMYAPEHLIVNTDDAEDWLPYLDNAGSVFLGRWTPESVGDYASGTNHVLPTYGYARMYGGVSLDSFVKYMTVQVLSRDGLKALGPSVAKMAEVEGLSAHQRAVTLRLADIASN